MERGHCLLLCAKSNNVDKKPTTGKLVKYKHYCLLGWKYIPVGVFFDVNKCIFNAVRNKNVFQAIDDKLAGLGIHRPVKEWKVALTENIQLIRTDLLTHQQPL